MATNYVEGFVLAVPETNKQAFTEHAAKAAALFKEHGALRVVDCWADSVPEGKLTDFPRAVKAEAGEIVSFGWVEYPSKAVRDAAMEKMMSDPRMAELDDMPFDGKRMIFGGFVPVSDI